MFQDFTATTNPNDGPPRLAALRAEMTAEGLDGFLVPRADVHQGEYVAAHDARLAWLTGFTGSAGFCAALHNMAGVFVDGRYRVQVKSQVADVFTPVDWPETRLGPWLCQHLPEGAKLGLDPWLHTVSEVETLRRDLDARGISLVPVDNLVDRIWDDQPAPPLAPVTVQPVEFAGKSHDEKRRELAQDLRDAGDNAAVITLADSLAWLLNIRGGDIERNPVPHGFAILFDDGRVDLFIAPEKIDGIVDHFGPDVSLHKPASFLSRLTDLAGPIRLDRSSAPLAVEAALGSAGIEISYGNDPCALPKARKTEAEIAGSVEAHLRDGAAVCEFLSWFDDKAKTGITEIDMVRHLEECRRATNALLDLSFDTIAGSGPHGAIMHYRVTEESNRTLTPGDLVVLDSGGQYRDGTTDITRTLPVGAVGAEEKAAFTRVLKGMIAVSRMRWPRGLAGCHIEAIGRLPLWMAGQDFDHGLGHGVGAYLCVHEGPQRLSRVSDVPLEPGMILSNEPGYYREGAFGIRIENLIAVEEAPALPGGDDHRQMLQFRTLTFAPIDRRMIDLSLLDSEERRWIDEYHATCRQHLSPRLANDAAMWLDRATAPL
ncbi:aminopeptidase P family protein [Shimia biformata]|uniref:aminopeptidase P family protein n=1 Tax=Shimia biformata TaxID=1294299 RepID=UPI0019506970|nr:aminopeptidase P family protein [Shimia biformata]